MLNAMTIDVEDYYHVSAFEKVIRPDDWGQHESRVERNTERLVELLDTHQTHATFFVLGWVAERQPQLIRRLVEQGHEVACHGYAHQRVYTQSPQQFRDETHRAKRLLEDTIGQPVYGYRAASYSITNRSLWALDILREAGFTYDSSIFPVRHDLYGIPNYPRFCHVLDGESGNGLVEFPLSTVQLGRFNLPMAGGGYFRIFPYAMTRWGMRRINHQEQRPTVFYLHPWEIDPEQPRMPVQGLSRFRHYVNLRKVEARLGRLLQDFSFGTMAAVLQAQGFLQVA